MTSLASDDLAVAPTEHAPSTDAPSAAQSKTNAYQVVFSAIKEQCLLTSADGPLLSPSGKPQSWMIDLRPLFLDAVMLNRIARMFLHKFGSSDPFQIAGMEVAAIPLLIGIALRSAQAGSPLNSCIIRKERKRYGRGRLIEGNLTDDPVILVDDILHSGASMEKARVVLAHEGKTVREAFVLIDYRSRKGMAWRKKHGIKVTSLFTLADFGLSLAVDKPPPQREWELVWQFSAEGASPFHVVPKSTPLLVASRLYFGSDSGTFWCLDANTGLPLWKFKAEGCGSKGIWSSPAHHDGRIYFGAYNGNLYCLEALTGRELWCNPACDWIGSSPCIVDKHGLLVIGLEYERPGAKGGMAAFDLATGEKLWERPMTRYQHGSAAYWEEGDLVICGNSDHSILAQRAQTGETVWEYPTQRSIKYAPAIDLERRLAIAASFDGHIYVVKLESGECLAKFKTGNICYTTPLIAFNRIFCGSGDKHLYVIDLETMKIADIQKYNSRIYSPPINNGAAVAFGTSSGRYYEIDPTTLNIISCTQMPDSITNAIVSRSDGYEIFVPTYMNELYCLRANLGGRDNFNNNNPIADSNSEKLL